MLKAAFDEITAVVRATDTFKALTVGAADGLDKRAKERTSLADELKTVNDEGGVRRGQTQVDLVALSKQLRHEAEAQARLVQRLRKFAEQHAMPDESQGRGA
jgi:hypothetical protein